jgi:hypothetical protein
MAPKGAISFDFSSHISRSPRERPIQPAVDYFQFSSYLRIASAAV